MSCVYCSQSSRASSSSSRNVIGLVISGTYKLVCLLGSGGHGKVYLAKDLRDNSSYAVKMELKNSCHPHLYNEYTVYCALNHPTHMKGIPRAYCYDEGSTHNALVMDIFGDRLRQPRFTNSHLVSVRGIFSVGIDLISILSTMHSRGFIHLDLKPENILRASTSDRPRVRIVDFGIAERYISARTGRHRPDEEETSAIGTVNFASRRTHDGLTRSRADDLETLGYVLIFLSVGRLPWHVHTERSRSCNPSHLQRFEPGLRNADTMFENVGVMKSNISIEDLCDGMPPEMNSYFEYVYGLCFFGKPDYPYLICLLRSALRRETCSSSCSRH